MPKINSKAGSMMYLKKNSISHLLTAADNVGGYANKKPKKAVYSKVVPNPQTGAATLVTVQTWTAKNHKIIDPDNTRMRVRWMADNDPITTFIVNAEEEVDVIKAAESGDLIITMEDADYVVVTVDFVDEELP